MSQDDGWIIRNDKDGLFVLQHYFASADELPDVEGSGYRFSTLEKAVLKFAELNNNDYPSEYGLSVQIEERVTDKMQTAKYARKPFHVEAIQVTKENMEAVATWCEGEIRHEDNGTAYIHVRVHRPLTDRQTKAFIGDWVLHSETGNKVYTAKAFSSSFELLPDVPEEIPQTGNVFENAASAS